MSCVELETDLHKLSEILIYMSTGLDSSGTDARSVSVFYLIKQIAFALFKMRV